MFRSTIQVTLFSVLGIIISFIIQLLLAYYFGATSHRDAYFAALTIPTYLTALFVGSIGMMLLPWLVKYSVGRDGADTIKFTSAVINFCCVMLLIIVLAGCLLAKPIMQVIIPASKQDIVGIAVGLFRIQIVSVLFTVLCNLLSPVFQSRHSFLVPAIFPIITSIITLLFVSIFSTSMGISSIAWGTLIGSLLSFLFVFVNVLKQFQYTWKFTFLHPDLRPVIHASFPLFAAGILFRSTTVFERFFAARLPEGSLSYLGSGNQIIVILSTLITGGIATTSFPLLSRYWSEKDLGSLEKTFKKVLSMIVLIIFPMIVIFIANGMDIVRIFFERGAFMPKDTAGLYYALLGLMGYFLFSSLGNVVVRLMYLSQHTWATAIIATIELMIYIGGAFFLSRQYGFVGLAVSMSAGSAFTIFTSLIFIKRKVVDLNMRHLFMQVGIYFILSCFALLLVFLLNRYLLTGLSSIARTAISVTLIALVYWIPVSMAVKKIGYQRVFRFLKTEEPR